MDSSADLPSLMDDAEFLEELEKMEGTPLPAAVHARTPVDAPPRGVPMRRDVDRYQVHPEGPIDLQHEDADAWADADAADASTRSRALPAMLTVVIGLSAGAAASALVFHERVAMLLALWAR